MKMFRTGWLKKNKQVKRGITWGVIWLFLWMTINPLGLISAQGQGLGEFPGLVQVFGLEQERVGNIRTASWNEVEEVNPEKLIRFHVLANSDSEEDQLLKYAVRDEILKEVAPRLAGSASLAESRTIILGMKDQFLAIGEQVIKEWGKNYPVTLDYGIHNFPTKSYGNIVLPGGEYEAVKIQIGEAQGANWWCVLFPPLCFVNVEESTSLPVDGKAAMPLDTAKKSKKQQEQQTNPGEPPDRVDKVREPQNNKWSIPDYKGKKVGFYFLRFLK